MNRLIREEETNRPPKREKEINVWWTIVSSSPWSHLYDRRPGTSLSFLSSIDERLEEESEREVEPGGQMFRFQQMNRNRNQFVPGSSDLTAHDWFLLSLPLGTNRS